MLCETLYALVGGDRRLPPYIKRGLKLVLVIDLVLIDQQNVGKSLHQMDIVQHDCFQR
jgi:hypothetical protein